MNYPSFSGFTANMPTPKAYYDQIIGNYIPTFLDTVNTRLHEAVVRKTAGIILVVRFIFSLLRKD